MILAWLLLAATSTGVVGQECLIPEQTFICGLCVFVDPRDCAGVCPPEGELSINEIDCSGACVERGTGSVYDICGVCGGNDQGCVDCRV